MNIDDTLKLQHVYDGLIRHLVPRGCQFHWTLVKALIRKESAFNPIAVSHMGATGLGQLMPNTDRWLDGDLDGTDIYGNLENTVKYLEWLHRYWVYKGMDGEDDEIFKFMLGSYNAGQGNIRKAQYRAKRKDMNGNMWTSIMFHLESVTGPANSRQTVDYVEAVMRYYEAYRTYHEPLDVM